MSTAMPSVQTPHLLPAVLLGVIQGLTEFLPVSSSGHLVIGSHFLPLATPSMLFDVILHVGTLLPVVWLYRKDLASIFVSLGRVFGKAALSERWRDDRGLRLAVCVVIGSVPTGVIGMLLKDVFEKLFSSPRVVGVTFLITGCILMLTLIKRGSVDKDSGEVADSHHTLTALRAILVGLAQGMAITPGISRSGTTITVGVLLGIERTMAARFSFLLSIPAILGAVALHLRKATVGDTSTILVYLAGAAAAGIMGYLALRWLVRLVRRGEMHWFSFYLWPLGIGVIVYTTFLS